ncbi:hypothetical protein [Cryptosporangium aurantiacum]|uniref:Dehydratase n=1 Tax=Cryptosporangium aurantiacum TaxID=134849 RepID=A0A1M7RK74_9ACTN|nr:hypothetical protein [Cryptosporangium aurantiacum]SHN46559.1 hypothetical protein SAMN05443668_11695 [Cryptosporangium aurantiacum]
MSSQPLMKRLAAVAVFGAATGVAVLTGGPAHADTVTVNYSCETPLSGTVVGDVEVTVTAPATATVGETVEITVTTGPTPVTSPIDLAAGSVTPSAEGVVSGAQTGTVTVTGPANPETIPAGTPIQLPPMTGQLTLTAPGQVDLTPGTASAVASTIFGTFTIPCTPTSPPGVAASIQVS